MKKIFSLILVVAMLSTVCMAASVGLDSAKVSTDGTSAINVVFKVSENFTTAYATAMVYYNKDAWTLSALGSDLAGASVTDDAANGIVNFMVMSVASATEGGAFIKFTATPKADVDVDGETFRLNSLTILDETGSGVIEDGTGADIVLTVEKAAADEKVYENDAIAAVATEIVDGDTFYKNLAVFDTVISLDGTKTAKKLGMKLASSLSANTFDVENAIGTEVSGDGQVAYAFVVYNVPTDATVTATPFVVYGN